MEAVARRARGLKNANVLAVGAGSRGGGGRPPGRPNMGGVQSDVCAWRLEQRPAILEKVAPVSLMSRDETSGLSIDTLGMSRVAGAGVGAAEDGATAGHGAAARPPAAEPIRARRVRHGVASLESPGAPAPGAIIFRCAGLGGLSVIAEAMV